MTPERMSPARFAATGAALVPEVLSPTECDAIAARVEPASAASGGTRSLPAHPWCALLARRLRAHPALSQLVPAGFAAVQCTYFEKSASRNWLVPIHQDLSIPVAERVDAPALTVGRVSAERAASVRKTLGEITCHAARGSALAMRPLLLHASSKAGGSSRRRVLHFLFGPRRLQHGLRWPQGV